MHPIDPLFEREYNNRALVPEHPAIFERWRNDSAAFRATADADLDVPYGTEPRHRMDLFRSPGARGTLVFIHGGYWRSLDKFDFSFLAQPFVSRGIAVAAFNYRLCPGAGVTDIVSDCVGAFAWLLAHGARFGIPVGRVALAGHSAGGHLVAMLFATDWASRGIEPACIVGGVALSSVSDLQPLLKCSMNEDLRLNAETARACSPINHRCQISAPLYLGVGADESAAFLTQTHQLRHAWPETCRKVDDLPGRNHFSIVDEFVRPESQAFRFVEGLFT